MQEAKNKVLKLEMEVNSADNIRRQLELRVQEYIEKLKNRDNELLTAQRGLQEARLLLEHRGVTREENGYSSANDNQKLQKDVFVLQHRVY